MKLTFPHMGNTYIAVKILFDYLGLDYVIPPLCNKEALRIGALHSPEEICLPFKIMIGNYIQSIEQGADTILLVGSCGPCRFGEYGELQMNLLKRLGYDLEFIVFDHVNALGMKEILNRMSRVTSASKKNTTQKFRALYLATKAINLIDHIEKRAHYLTGFEITKGEFKRLLNKCIKECLQTNDGEHAIRILQKYKKDIESIPINKLKKSLKIAIIGEIFTVIEPFSNLYIEEMLMDYGISTIRTLTPSWWVKNSLLKPVKLNSINIRKASMEYLPLYIGGHARECIGEAVLAHQEGYDGAIQIFPMGCMPEIVSKSIIPNISKDKDFPIMSLVVDEMTGREGYKTRIEAFLDLLERRKMNVLSRC